MFVRDFDSTNGTFVNDEPVKGQREVHHQDQLRVGPLTFRVSIEVTAPVNKPPPKPAEGNSEDDSVAAMLLAIQDDSGGPSSGLKDADGVPEGSTVMDMSPVTAASSGEAETPAEIPVPRPEAKKPEPAKQEGANTSSAAKAILDRYTRRPRG